MSSAIISSLHQSLFVNAAARPHMAFTEGLRTPVLWIRKVPQEWPQVRAPSRVLRPKHGLPSVDISSASVQAIHARQTSCLTAYAPSRESKCPACCKLQCTTSSRPRARAQALQHASIAPFCCCHSVLGTTETLSKVWRMRSTAYRQDKGMAEQAFCGWPLQRVLVHALPHKVPELLAARPRRRQRHGFVHHLRRSH